MDDEIATRIIEMRGTPLDEIFDAIEDEFAMLFENRDDLESFVRLILKNG